MGCDPWWPPREAVRVSVCLPFLSVQFCCWFSRSGFAKHFFLETDGCCRSRILVGSSAFVTDRGFLWPYLSWWVACAVACSCSSVRSFVFFFWFMLVCRRPRRGRSTGLLCFCRHVGLLPPSRAGYKYGALCICFVAPLLVAPRAWPGRSRFVCRIFLRKPAMCGIRGRRLCQSRLVQLHHRQGLSLLSLTALMCCGWLMILRSA